MTKEPLTQEELELAAEVECELMQHMMSTYPQGTVPHHVILYAAANFVHTMLQAFEDKEQRVHYLSETIHVVVGEFGSVHEGSRMPVN